MATTRFVPSDLEPQVEALAGQHLDAAEVDVGTDRIRLGLVERAGGGPVVGCGLGLVDGVGVDVLDVAHAFTPDLCSPNPVEPNPPSPRMLPGSRSTSTNRARLTGITTSCAMRSPASIV